VSALAEASLRREEALREADRRKDEFLGMLSHELRNPLAPIRNSIYILRHTAPGSEQAARAQSIIERQTEHLTRLVDDLLDVTRIARGKIDLRRSRVDLREVVTRAADDFHLLLHDHGVAFVVDVPGAPLWADADPTRVTQIVGNLLHNSVKFTRRGDEVRLSLRQAGERDAEIRVRDTGVGIEPALLPKVFEAFVQGERTLARTEGGLGLGLALVKGIAEMHGGTVRVDSAGEGAGTDFVISLPLAP
jgi:signal transduction histidine kinase